MAASLRSLRSIAKVALASALFPQNNGVLAGQPETCTNTQLSCHNTTVQTNTCCFNTPGGQLLQTQFWDTDPPTGPTNSWTIHGLWPDNCDGSFQEDCDEKRAYTNISSILTAAGATSVLSQMNTFWKNDDGTDESFWDHEWETHGTCISTIEPSCYVDYTPQQEVVDYFTKVVDLFMTLDSFQFLSAAGITPSTTKTYTSAQVLAALKTPRGVTAVIQCSGSDLDEIYYFFNVNGNLITGTFEASNPVGESSGCPSTGIRYLPKTAGTALPTTTAAAGTAPPTSTPVGTPSAPFTGKGFLEVTSGGSPTGCIISAGTWFVSGTCATFTATASGTGLTLVSSKGPCTVTAGKFTCAAGNTASVFTNVNGNLAFDGSTTFFASEVPAGQTQVTVETATDSQSLTITWSPM